MVFSLIDYRDKLLLFINESRFSVSINFNELFLSAYLGSLRSNTRYFYLFFEFSKNSNKFRNTERFW